MSARHYNYHKDRHLLNTLELEVYFDEIVTAWPRHERPVLDFSWENGILEALDKTRAPVQAGKVDAE